MKEANYWFDCVGVSMVWDGGWLSMVGVGVVLVYSREFLVQLGFGWSLLAKPGKNIRV